jgi:hypothetical protein
MLRNGGVELIHSDSPVAGFCEHGNEPSDFIKDEEFLTS